MTRLSRTIGVATALLVAPLALAACSSPSDAEGTSDAESGQEAEVSPTTEDVAAAETPSPEPAAEETPAPEPTTEDPGAAGDCLIGDWLVSDDQMQAFYDAMDVPADFTIAGDTGLSFTQDAYEFTPDYSLHMDVAGQSAEATMTGSVAGSYTVDGDVITTKNDENDMSVSVTVGGQTIDGGDMVGGFMEASPIANTPYECTPDGPVLMFETDGPDRQPMQLVPRS